MGSGTVAGGGPPANAGIDKANVAAESIIANLRILFTVYLLFGFWRRGVARAAYISSLNGLVNSGAKLCTVLASIYEDRDILPAAEPAAFRKSCARRLLVSELANQRYGSNSGRQERQCNRLGHGSGRRYPGECRDRQSERHRRKYRCELEYFVHGVSPVRFLAAGSRQSGIHITHGARLSILR